MTPDLSAAFLRCKDFLTLPGFVDVENASPECVADLLLIAREWAKTARRDDDDDRITEEWLLSVGFVKGMSPTARQIYISNITFEDIDRGWVTVCDLQEAAIIGHPIKTRGELRRLCYGLRIELKESRP